MAVGGTYAELFALQASPYQQSQPRCLTDEIGAR